MQLVDAEYYKVLKTTTVLLQWELCLNQMFYRGQFMAFNIQPQSEEKSRYIFVHISTEA